MAKKKNYKEQRIRGDIIKFGCTVFYCSEWDKSALAYTETRDCDTFYPAIYFNTTKPISIASIIHEAIHAVRYDLGHRKGFEGLGNWEDEVLPYSVQYVVSEILAYCKKHKIKTTEKMY